MADQKSKNKQSNSKNVDKNTSVRKKRRKGITVGQLTIFIAIVIGVILFLIINAVMRNRYLKVTNISGEYAIGTTFDINNYVEPVNENAYLECEVSADSIDTVGFIDIEYTVRCGKLKKTNTVTVEVVDNSYPEIVGPDELGVLLDEDIDLLDYYTVLDAEPDLEESLMINKAIDTSETGYTDYVLGVTDWGNNYTSKEIMIIVCDYSEDVADTARAVREYNRLNGYAVADGVTVYLYYPDESDGKAYVLIGDSDLFEVAEDGTCTLLELDEELADTIIAEGTVTDISSLKYFNYNYSN